MPKPETKFRLSKVDPFLKTLKNSWFTTVQQVSITGTPDKLGCCAGRFVALELKSAGGKLGKLQEYNLHKVMGAGGVALVAHPGNWEDVKMLLTKLDQGEDVT